MMTYVYITTTHGIHNTSPVHSHRSGLSFRLSLVLAVMAAICTASSRSRSRRPCRAARRRRPPCRRASAISSVTPRRRPPRAAARYRSCSSRRRPALRRGGGGLPARAGARPGAGAAARRVQSASQRLHRYVPCVPVIQYLRTKFRPKME